MTSETTETNEKIQLRLFAENFGGLLEMSTEERDAIVVALIKWRLGDESSRPKGLLGFAFDVIKAANERLDSRASIGRATGGRKAEAARENGKRGGRPRIGKPKETQSETEREPKENRKKPNENPTVTIRNDTNDITPKPPQGGETVDLFGDPDPKPFDVAAAFARFWQAWPRKVDKGHAERTFCGLMRKAKDPQGLLDAILAAVERQRKQESWQRDAGRYIPHAATWLNGRRWEDENEVAPLPRESEEERQARVAAAIEEAAARAARQCEEIARAAGC